MCAYIFAESSVGHGVAIGLCSPECDVAKRKIQTFRQEQVMQKVQMLACTSTSYLTQYLTSTTENGQIYLTFFCVPQTGQTARMLEVLRCGC